MNDGTSGAISGRDFPLLVKAAGLRELDQISPHTLRHTFAADLYRVTKNIRMVQKALGHSDLSTSMIYTHIIDDKLEDATRNLVERKECKA